MREGTVLDALIRRLEKTSGRRIARRNARLALRRFLQQVWREQDHVHPPIRKDGSEVVRHPKHGVQCPVCRAPGESFAQLVIHAMNSHGRLEGWKITCWCGKTWLREGTTNGRRFFGSTNFARHLAGVADLATHAVVGAMSKQ